MSAFDDEFGLFGDDAEDDQERRSTLGARNIATGETTVNDIEPEDERQPRREPQDRPAYNRRRGSGRPSSSRGPASKGRPGRGPADPAAAQQRASELLAFLAKRLVAKADRVSVDSFPPESGDPPALELVVDPEDLGKVIGRSGRVAQALRTIVRAAAEGKLTVDIYDTEEIAASQAEYEAQDGK